MIITPDEDRADVGNLRDCITRLTNGKGVPLAQVASFSYGLENPLIWRRNRLPTITVQSDIAPGVEATTANQQLKPTIDKVRAQLPAGYRLEVGGSAHESVKGQVSVVAVIPMMLLAIVLILMIQLQSVQKLLIVL